MTALYRLRGRVRGLEVELLMPSGPAVLGSAPDCDLVVDHATVSRRHAELRADEEGVQLVDLGSKNGTYVDRERVRRCRLHTPARVRFGQVELALERLEAGDEVVAVELERQPEEAPAGSPQARSTASLNPFERFVRGTLLEVITALGEGPTAADVAQRLGHGLFTALPLTELTVVSRGEEGPCDLFSARRPQGSANAVPVARMKGDLRIEAEFADDICAEVFTVLLDLALEVVAVAVGRTLPAAPLPRTEPPPLPEPRTVDPAVLALYEDAARVARTRVGVLICGESGTGKEVLARFIHQASGCAGGPFVALNCAALPRDLLEAELFGIEGGVATGVAAREGKLELAHGGTLFLDEIGDMALATQAMILRALQEREVYRIGGSRARAAEVRIIAATNHDIDQLLASGEFRLDLYYRVATWTARLPALRHRRADIGNLAAFFLAREARLLGKRVRGISRAALEALVAYRWPGNIRQLENEIARAVAFVAEGGSLDSGKLGADILAGSPPAAGAPLAERLAAVERQEILRALQQCSGDTARAAQSLGVHRTTLYRRMKALAIDTGSGLGEEGR